MAYYEFIVLCVVALILLFIAISVVVFNINNTLKKIFAIFDRRKNQKKINFPDRRQQS